MDKITHHFVDIMLNQSNLRQISYIPHRGMPWSHDFDLTRKKIDDIWLRFSKLNGDPVVLPHIQINQCINTEISYSSGKIKN